MTNEEFVKVGIIAARELDVPLDAKIEIAPDEQDYVIQKVVDEGYDWIKFETDVVIAKRWAEENWVIGIGYSKKYNTLIIWPAEIWDKLRNEARRKLTRRR